MNTLIREAWRGIRRNRSAFIMSVSVQAVCLLLLTVFAVVTLNLSNLLRVAQSRVEVYAFITDDAVPEDLTTSLKLISGVSDVRYVSKEQALSELKQDMGSSSAVVDLLGHNPLPASLRIKLAPGYVQARSLGEIERKISIMPGVKDVWSGQELLGKLERIFSVALGLDIALLVIIGLAVLFVVFQAIESVIVTRSKEIEIMRLVGATDKMVRAPFYWEGIVQGLGGGLVAFVLSMILYEILLSAVPQPFFPVGLVALFDILLGGGLGFLGADIALARLVK